MNTLAMTISSILFFTQVARVFAETPTLINFEDGFLCENLPSYSSTRCSEEMSSVTYCEFFKNPNLLKASKSILQYICEAHQFDQKEINSSGKQYQCGECQGQEECEGCYQMAHNIMTASMIKTKADNIAKEKTDTKGFIQLIASLWPIRTPFTCTKAYVYSRLKCLGENQTSHYCDLVENEEAQFISLVPHSSQRSSFAPLSLEDIIDFSKPACWQKLITIGGFSS